MEAERSVTIETIGALVEAMWGNGREEAGVLRVTFMISLLITAVAALMTLAPPTARLRQPDGSDRDVPPGEIPVGGVLKRPSS